jgi:hypothetical protein
VLLGAERPGTPALNRRSAFAGIVLVASSSWAAPAAAHNGRTAFAGALGPYDTAATVEYRHEQGTRAVVLDVALRTADLRPAPDAEVTLTARSGDRTVGPLAAERFGSTYRVVIPDDGVPTWAVTVTVTGPAGDATAEREVPGAGTLRGDAGEHPDNAPVPGAGAGDERAVTLALLAGGAGLTLIAFVVLRRTGRAVSP